MMVISWLGSTRFMRIAKYKPEGPAPTIEIFTLRSPDDLGEAVELLRVRCRRKQDQLVAARVRVAADLLAHRLGRGEQSGGDALDEAAGEGVVVAHVLLARTGVGEGEVGLAPQRGLARPSRLD